uniref:Beta-bungarotoxin b chain isoform 3 n=1 Tax=Bungarus flaviceps TaxID=8614 RepID=D5J9R2_9SAUR|nr:beta-bungarotoxin b chain isoform 3 [Bungarus flaviceps]
MSSGSLLLLLGLLTLLAELTPVSSRKRHPDCDKPPNKKRCTGHIPAFYYNPQRKTCERFSYGGCKGNGNHFKTPQLCMCRCHE